MILYSHKRRCAFISNCAGDFPVSTGHKMDSRILTQNLSFKMFLRVNLFVIISLYRVFLLRFGSEGMFQFLFHQQICLIHFFSQWWRQTNDPPFKPFLIDVGQNGEFINQNGCFYAKNQRSQTIQWYQFGSNAVAICNKVS